MIFVRMTMNVLPEKQKELLQTLLSLIEPTGMESGCLSCSILRDIGDRNRFCLLEEWETREDLDCHMASNRFGVLLGTRTLLCEPLKIQIHTVFKTEGSEATHRTRKKNR